MRQKIFTVLKLKSAKFFVGEKRAPAAFVKRHEIFAALVVESHVRKNFFGVELQLDLLILRVCPRVDKNIPAFATVSVAL